MLPALSTAMVMFSGLVCVGIFTAFGSSSGTVLVITGMVMRKMMSSTSITSTSGVVLMVAIMPPPPSGSPTCMDIFSYSLRGDSARGPSRVVPQPRPGSPCERRGLGSSRARTARRTLDLHATNQIGMQVAGEVPQRVLQHLVTAEQPVVAPHRGHRHEQAERRHDERLAYGAGHLVDARLAGDADADERVEDAPYRAEQSHEGRGRANGSQEAQTPVQLAVHRINRALQRHGDPFVQIDAVGETTIVMGGGAQTVLGNAAEIIALLQPVDAVLHRRRAPELLVDVPRRLAQLALVPQLREDHVPGGERHEQQQDEHGTGDQVAGHPQCTEAVRIVNGYAALIFHSFLETKKQPHPRCGRCSS